jgi:hypothetical protein
MKRLGVSPARNSLRPENALPSDEELDVVARRVLLDAIQALHPHIRGLIVVGAQAIYLRTGRSRIPVAPYTTDGDLALDPALLGEDPIVESAMTSAGFNLFEPPGDGIQPGTWIRDEYVRGVPTVVPVDLLVPEALCPIPGRRDAHLDEQGTRVARRAEGLEATLVDNSLMSIGALDPNDFRSFEIKVAELPSLLVAKLHKIHDRATSGRASRLSDKDGSDAYRIMEILRVRDAAARLTTLLADPMAGSAVATSLTYLDELFGHANGAGIEMAQRALRLGVAPDEVSSLSIAWTRQLLRSVFDR